MKNDWKWWYGLQDWTTNYFITIILEIMTSWSHSPSSDVINGNGVTYVLDHPLNPAYSSDNSQPNTYWSPDWIQDSFFRYQPPLVSNTRNNFLATAKSMWVSTMVITDILWDSTKEKAFNSFLISLSWNENDWVKNLWKHLLEIFKEITGNTNTQWLSSVKTVKHAKYLHDFVIRDDAGIQKLSNKFFSDFSWIWTREPDQIRKILYAAILDLTAALLQHVSNAVPQAQAWFRDDADRLISH